MPNATGVISITGSASLVNVQNEAYEEGATDVAEGGPPAAVPVVSMITDKATKTESTRFGAFKKQFLELLRTIKRHPVMLILPLIAFGLMVGLGIWGVLAAASDSAVKERDKARSTAIDVATSFQLQLKEVFSPAATLTMLIEQNPDWDFWEGRYQGIADELIARSIPGSIYNIQLQPLGQVRYIEPLRENDRSQPGKDLLVDSERRPTVLGILSKHRPGISVVYLVPQNITVAFIRYPVYIYGTAANDTFGYSFPGANYTIPEFPENVYYPPVGVGGPLGYKNNCSLCYIPANDTAPSERWWGFITLTINFDSLVKGQDNRFERLTESGLMYTLQRPVGATSSVAIVDVGDIQLSHAVNVSVTPLDGVIWQLWVQSYSGWGPFWKGPLIGAVIVIAFVISTLAFVALLYYFSQDAMLKETMETNAKLEKMTAELKAEKERLDSLLTRQYGLLACLDLKALNNSTTAAKTGLTMDRIEEARRMVTDAATRPDANTEQIELFELLGEGSFGKVNRGMWRGTVVAVKTMILPANMPGSEKREKMAVMEAAISSSLAHPNIVTTYTYSIRPYTDSELAGAPMGESLGSLINCVPLESATYSSSSNADQSEESFVHSYQVRMVLEYCDKGSLWEALEQGAFLSGADGTLNVTAMVEAMIDVGSAMVHMHAASVLHSDLKARNIMLKSSGMAGRGFICKVADFGLSTQLQHTETHVSSMFQGTLTHMAPEVLMEGHISKAGDVYSFGIMMWEVFTASMPFADVPKSHMGYAITKGDQRPLFPTFAPKVYSELAQRCWAADYSTRPTFEDIIATLQAMLKTLPSVKEPLTISPPKPIMSTPSRKRIIDLIPARSSNSVGAILVGNDQSVALSVSKSYSTLTPVLEVVEDAEVASEQASE